MVKVRQGTRTLRYKYESPQPGMCPLLCEGVLATFLGANPRYPPSNKNLLMIGVCFKKKIIIEVKFTYHKTNHFKVSNSLVFNTFTMCNYDLYLVLKSHNLFL